MIGGRREDVENAAAHSVFTAAGHHVHTAVGQTGQPFGELFQIGFAADGKFDRLKVAQALDQRLGDSADGRDDDRQRSVSRVRQATQHRQALADRVRTRGQSFVRQSFPRREHGNGARTEVIG